MTIGVALIAMVLQPSGVDGTGPCTAASIQINQPTPKTTPEKSEYAAAFRCRVTASSKGATGRTGIAAGLSQSASPRPPT